jgi:hypothetical protein
MLEPVFAWITSYLLTGESLSARAAAGAGLILAGILLVELKPFRQDARAPDIATTLGLRDCASSPCCSAVRSEVRDGGAHRWALFGRIHARGDGRRAARGCAGADGVAPALSGRASSRGLRVLGAAGRGGGAARPSASRSGKNRPKADRER